jgi:uncharacterized protein YkwD
MSDFNLVRLLAAGVAATAMSAVPAQADELATLINAYRAEPGSCAGRPAQPVPALTPEPALARLQVGSGTFLEPALKRLGYRADRAEVISVTGPIDARAALDAIQNSYCGKLLSQEFSAIGTARQGNAWQVVLAHPLVFPTLPDWEEAGRQILAEVNRARAQTRSCGQRAYAPAPPLTWNQQLGQAALGHSSNMAEGRYFSHQEKNGSTPADRATRAGYAWKVVGENIASGNRTPQDAVEAWLDSPGHCANIMNPTFMEMGAAYAINPLNDNRTPYWTQVFGRPR